MRQWTNRSRVERISTQEETTFAIELHFVPAMPTGVIASRVAMVIIGEEAAESLHDLKYSDARFACDLNWSPLNDANAEESDRRVGSVLLGSACVGEYIHSISDIDAFELSCAFVEHVIEDRMHGDAGQLDRASNRDDCLRAEHGLLTNGAFSGQFDCLAHAHT